MLNEQNKLYELIFKEYKKLQFSRSEAAKLIGRSVKTLDNMRKEGVGPAYKKRNTPGERGAVVYPINAIVKYVCEENWKTAS